MDQAQARIEARRRAVPVISYPPELPVSQLKDEIAEVISGPPGGDRRGRDRVGQDHPAAQDLPGAGPRRGRADRPHPAPPHRGPDGGRADRRGAGHRDRRRGRLQDPVHRHRQRRRAGQGHDRRHPADRDAARPAAAALRHADHRRGARAQPEHRLHPGLPAPAAAQSRPDLKVIITSATIDPERFSKHFERRAGDRGVRAHLPGRGAVPAAGRPRRARSTSRRTRSRASSTPWPSCAATARATSWCSSAASGRSGTPPTRSPMRDGLEVLPLYARLSAAEQHRCSSRTRGRRVVLATNVAETSLTVPGIHYVIDPGTARISRYSHRTKVQRLPIEPISQASASQRAGRCGRTADGICIRLYSRGRLRRPARVHRAGDPADQPGLGHPADGRPGPGRDRRLPVRRPAGRPQRGRRHPAAGGAGRGYASASRPPRSSPTPAASWPDLPLDPRLGRMILEAGQHGCAARC